MPSTKRDFDWLEMILDEIKTMGLKGDVAWSHLSKRGHRPKDWKKKDGLPKL